MSINISGDISLMDANDAASYVQDLAGEEANIIFGAKYDDSVPDTATITVIATGLERPSASKNSFSGMSMRFGGSSASSAAAQKPDTAAQAEHIAETLQTPQSPTPTVEQKNIQIPDFLKARK